MSAAGSNVSPLFEVEKTALYRHYDRSDDLLYVGISTCAVTRLSAHARSSDWFSLISNVSIEWYDSRSDALDAECLAIFMERPRFNTIASMNRLRTFFCPLSDRRGSSVKRKGNPKSPSLKQTPLDAFLRETKTPAAHVARDANVSAPYLHDLRYDKRKPSAKVADAIASATGGAVPADSWVTT